MIDFSKNADHEITVQREIENADGKRERHTSDRSVHVNYDFADRDQQRPENNEDVIVKVPEKVNAAEPVKNKYRFDKPSFSGCDNRIRKDYDLTK